MRVLECCTNVMFNAQEYNWTIFLYISVQKIRAKAWNHTTAWTSIHHMPAEDAPCSCLLPIIWFKWCNNYKPFLAVDVLELGLGTVLWLLSPTTAPLGLLWVVAIGAMSLGLACWLWLPNEGLRLWLTFPPWLEVPSWCTDDKVDAVLIGEPW